jgi:ERCC4-type nuclease
MKLIIDHRESHIKEIINNKNYTNINFEYKNIDHGDFIFEINDKQLLVIERKTIADLAASIKDGRYSNQKIELLNNYNRRNIYYIIEGNFSGYSEDTNICIGGLDKKHLVGSILNTMIRDDIKIFFTQNINETIDLLINIYNRISKDPNKYTEPQQESFITTKKSNKNSTYFNMLCQIPGISNKIANNIINKYPTFNILFNSLKDIDDLQKLKELKEIKTESNKAISKTTLNCIINTLFNNE